MSTSADLVLSMLTLHREGRTGVATILNEGLTTFVYFRDGVLVFAEEGTHGETLGRLLVRQQQLRQEHYVEIISKMTDALVINEQLRFGEVAVELGYLTEAQVGKALGDQIRWKVVRVFQRPNSTWDFEDSRSRVEDAGNIPMQIESLVLEAMRWIDDDEKMALGLARWLDKPFRVPPEAAPSLALRFGLTAAEQTFAARLDGTLTARQLLAAKNEDCIDTYAVLTALILARVNLPAKPAPVAPVAPALPPAHAAPVIVAAPALPVVSLPLRSADAPAAPASRRAGMPLTRTSKILEALGAARTKVDPHRDPASEHEARLLAERAFQAGLGHMKSGRHDQASAELRRAAQLLPSSSEYRVYEKWCALRARAELPHQLELAELGRLVAAALGSDPNFAFGHFVAGELAFGDGKIKAALRHLKHASKLDHGLVEAERLIRVVERRIANRETSG